MEEQFIPYEKALALKKLEFDKENCFGWWTYRYNSTEGYLDTSKAYCFQKNDDLNQQCLAPLWQQAFDFFQEKFKLSSSIQLKSKNHLGENYEVVIINFADFISEETTFRKDGFKTPLEAKNYCLNALIQFCS